MIRSRFLLPRAARASSLAVVASLLAAAASTGPTAGADPAAWTPESMMAVPLPGQVAVAPGGGQVAYVVWRSVMTDDVSEERGRIWVAGGNEPPRALTPEEASADSPRWSPDGKAIAYLAAADNSPQIWLRVIDRDEGRQITAAPAGIRDFRWLPDGRSLLFIAGSGPSPQRLAAARRHDDAYAFESDPDNSRLWRVDLSATEGTPSPGRALTPPDFHVAAEMGLSFGYMLSGFDVSPDGRHVAFTRTPSAAVADWRHADVALLDLATGEVRALAASGRAEGSPRFSRDGRWVAYTASGDPPTASFAARVEVVPLDGGKARTLAPTVDERPRLLGWSADSRSIFFSEVRGTLTRLSVLPLDGGPPSDLDDGDGVLSSIDLDATGTRLGLVAEASDQSPEVFVSPVEPFALRRVSALAARREDPPLGRTELIRWTSFDGLEIEGLLTYPVGYRAGRRYPLLLVVHGGPTYYFLQDYIAAGSEYPLAAFAADGFAVLRANPRGSSGRGRTFRFANRGDWGGGDYRDLMAGVDRVIAMGVADPERLGVMGWSYGGYMTAWIVSQTRRFKAASVGAGIADLVSFAGTTDIVEFAADYFGGPPWVKPQLYLERSPLFHLAAATTPTLIQQGAQDRRVPTSQGVELYRALRKIGVETRFVLYPRQGHSIDEPKLLLDVARGNLDWFRAHLLPATP